MSKTRVRRSRRPGLYLSLALVLALAAACGSDSPGGGSGPPPGGGSPGNGGGQPPDGGDPADELPDDPEERLAYLSQLTGDEREQRLIEVAAEESGTIVWYTGHNEVEYSPVVDAFEDRYGISVEVFRAGSGDMLVRVFEEWNAGQLGSDILEQGQFSTELFNEEGMLAPWDSPHRDAFSDAFKTDNSVGTKVLFFVPSWNTELIQSPLPTDWVEFLEEIPNRPERFSFETGDWDWFGELVKYLVAERGFTEEEAIQLFEDAAADAIIESGHSLQVDLLVAGNFAATVSSYNNRIEDLKGQGAPIEWLPTVEPVPSTYNAVSITRPVTNPASALLLADFLINEGQDIYLQAGAVPARSGVSGAEHMTDGFEILPISAETHIDEREKWEPMYLDRILGR